MVDDKYIKHCVICGIELKRGRKKTCSSKCYGELEREYNRLWARSHRKYRIKNCLNCGKELLISQKKYCSTECGNKYYNKNLRDPIRTKEIARKYKLSHKKPKTLRDKIVKKISNKIRRVLNGERRSVNYKDVLSYSDSQLKSHLEKQFKDGMSWDNYGEWHIDHKIPVSAFNLMCDEDIKRCWSLKNLQPLFADENIRKSNKLDRPFQPLLI